MAARTQLRFALLEHEDSDDALGCACLHAISLQRPGAHRIPALPAVSWTRGASSAIRLLAQRGSHAEAALPELTC